MLTRTESVRALAVLQEALERLLLLEDLTPDVTVQQLDLQETVGKVVERILEEQRVLQQRYNVLLNQRLLLRAGTASRLKLQEVDAEIRATSERLSAVTVELCRHIKENPNIAENLRKVQRDRGDLISLFRNVVTELRENSVSLLLDHIHQEKSKQDSLHETVARQRENAMNLEELQTNLHREREQRRYDSHVHSEEIATLKEKLTNARRDSEMRVRMVKQEKAAQLQASRRLHDQRLSQLEDELAVLGRHLEIENRVNTELQGFLERRNSSLEGKLKEWQERSEREIDTSSSELKRMRDQLADAQTTFVSLKAKYDDVSAFLERERLAEEERQRREADLARKRTAVTDIQALWLGYKERQLQEKERKKAKKGAGKKGKKGAK